MAEITVTYKFDYYGEQSELKELMSAQHARSALWEVDQELRTKIKYGDDKLFQTEGVQNYLEKIREMIFESGALRDE